MLNIQEIGDTVFEENIKFNVTPIGVVDGVNDTFTLPDTPVEGTVIVHILGARAFPGASKSYEVSGNTITFTQPPRVGVKLLVDYIKQS